MSYQVPDTCCPAVDNGVHARLPRPPTKQCRSRRSQGQILLAASGWVKKGHAEIHLKVVTFLFRLSSRRPPRICGLLIARVRENSLLDIPMPIVISQALLGPSRGVRSFLFLWFCRKQTVGNACGTVGLLHCALNASVSRGITLGEHARWPEDDNR